MHTRTARLSRPRARRARAPAAAPAALLLLKQARACTCGASRGRSWPVLPSSPRSAVSTRAGQPRPVPRRGTDTMLTATLGGRRCCVHDRHSRLEAVCSCPTCTALVRLGPRVFAAWAQACCMCPRCGAAWPHAHPVLRRACASGPLMFVPGCTLGRPPGRKPGRVALLGLLVNKAVWPVGKAFEEQYTNSSSLPARVARSTSCAP